MSGSRAKPKLPFDKKPVGRPTTHGLKNNFSKDSRLTVTPPGPPQKVSPPRPPAKKTVTRRTGSR